MSIQAIAAGERHTDRRNIGGSRSARSPNVHAGLHYPDTAEEYALTVNLHVIMGEAFHKILKDGIYTTNFNNAERDLLWRQSVAMTARLVLQGAYPDYPELTAQIKRLYAAKPKLFDSFLPRSERKVEEAAEDGDTVQDDDEHFRILAGERIAAYTVRDMMLLPTTGTNMEAAFKQALTMAYNSEFRINVQTTNSRPIKWWKRASFNDR